MDMVELFSQALKEILVSQLTSIKARRGLVALSRGGGFIVMLGKAWLVVLTNLWHLNLPYRSHDVPQVAYFKVQGEKKRYSYITVLEFKSNKIVAMHVLQRLVYILGTNNAYVMISNMARA